MGNMAFLYCLLQNANNSKFPKLQKEVAMAGTFDGVIGWNQPATCSITNEPVKPRQLPNHIKNSKNCATLIQPLPAS